MPGLRRWRRSGRGCEMPVSTIFDLCTSRPDILQGRVTEAEFAGDLARVLANGGGTGDADYANPAVTSCLWRIL